MIHIASTRALVIAVAFAAAVVGLAGLDQGEVSTSQESSSPSLLASIPTQIAGVPLQAGLGDAPLPAQPAPPGGGAKESVASGDRILGVANGIGAAAAPVRRFRDGGHAYYLFGMGLHACTYVGKCMDLFAPVGEPVYAMAGGELTIPPYAPASYGKYVVIKYMDGSKAIYAHLARITAKPGAVSAGARIGTVGCSGTSGEDNDCQYSEAHLHYEWSGLHWNPGEYGELPPYFSKWRGQPRRCFHGCK